MPFTLRKPEKTGGTAVRPLGTTPQELKNKEEKNWRNVQGDAEEREEKLRRGPRGDSLSTANVTAGHWPLRGQSIIALQRDFSNRFLKNGGGRGVDGEGSGKNSAIHNAVRIFGKKQRVFGGK